MKGEITMMIRGNFWNELEDYFKISLSEMDLIDNRILVCKNDKWEIKQIMPNAWYLKKL